jgi:Fe(II)/alpha-ketoglutarate-dependent arginine beta-hydroxylase
MHRLELSGKEIAAIQSLLNEIVIQHSSVEAPDFLRNASIYAHELPSNLRVFLNDLRLLEQPGACLVSGYPIDDAKIGRTPEHWNIKASDSPTLHEEIFFVLCGSLLGDVFGWSTQQDGYILHDVLPIKEHENKQISSGSEQTIWWHTEDAFHPYKADYIGLMCLRNPDKVATTFASMDVLELDQEHVKVLFEPRFIIRPDESHLEKDQPGAQGYAGNSNGLLKAAYARIQQMNSNPQRVPILFGDPESPYLCLDPYFMDFEQLDAEAKRALEALIEAIDANLTDIVLQPGDCCFIDNCRAVHGRNSFKPRYDGYDRWLKRLNITRDLRKSRSFRASSASRILF